MEINKGVMSRRCDEHGPRHRQEQGTEYMGGEERREGEGRGGGGGVNAGVA